MNEIWTKRAGESINFDIYENKEDIFETQRNNPAMVYIALLFDNDPIQNNSIRLCTFSLQVAIQYCTVKFKMFIHNTS